MTRQPRFAGSSLRRRGSQALRRCGRVERPRPGPRRRAARGAAPCRSNDRRCVRVIGEKTPNNLVYFSPLKQLFAKAKFLDVVRDGRDCIVSTWFHNPRTNPAELQRRHPSFEDFAESLAASWKAWVEAACDFGEFTSRSLYHRPL